MPIRAVQEYSVITKPVLSSRRPRNTGENSSLPWAELVGTLEGQLPGHEAKM